MYLAMQVFKKAEQSNYSITHKIINTANCLNLKM